MAAQKASPTKKPSNGLSMHDQELLSAKNGSKLVRIVLAQETYFTDDDCSVCGHVEYVDRYAIKISTNGAHRGAVWVTKQAILSTELLT